MNAQLPTETLTFLSIVISARYIFRFIVQGITKVASTLRAIREAHELIDLNRKSFEDRFERIETKVDAIEHTVFKIYEHITR